jgi:hypothetical protein
MQMEGIMMYRVREGTSTSILSGSGVLYSKSSVTLFAFKRKRLRAQGKSGFAFMGKVAMLGLPICHKNCGVLRKFATLVKFHVC